MEECSEYIDLSHPRFITKFNCKELPLKILSIFSARVCFTTTRLADAIFTCLGNSTTSSPVEFDI